MILSCYQALIDLVMDINVCTYDVILKNAQKLLNTASSHPRDSREQFGFSFETELVHLCYEYFRWVFSWPDVINPSRDCITYHFTLQNESAIQRISYVFELGLILPLTFNLIIPILRQLKKSTKQKAWPHLLNLLRECCLVTNQPPVILLALGFLQLFLANLNQVRSSLDKKCLPIIHQLSLS